MKKYLYWNSEIEISSYPNGAILLEVKNYTPTEILVRRNVQKYQINDTASQILQLINGERTYDEIIQFLSNKYSESTEIIGNKVYKFLGNLKKLYNIYPLEQEESQMKNLNIKSRSALYPMVATIETTDRCNLKCRHCYGNYEKVNTNIMPLDKIKKLLWDLKNIGVRIIEFTGGEATTHPHIVEIVQHALSLEFESITILSNGVNISEQLLKVLVDNKEKICIQIDLHSLNEEYMTWFTGVPRIMPFVKKNIEVIAKAGIRMRVITIVTKRNMNEIEDIAEYVHSTGTRQYAVSLVIPMGRATDEKDLILEESDLITLDSVMRKINNKYKEFLSIIKDGAQKATNCGCLTSNVVISSSGYIKICAMNSLKEIDCSIGNVFDENIKNIFERQSKFIGAFFDAKAPRIYFDECKECENASFCHGCMLRGLSKAKQMGNKCQWYNTYISTEMREQIGF